MTNITDIPKTPTLPPAPFRRRRFSNRRREATASDLSATAVTTTAKSVVTVTSIVPHYVASTTTTLTTSTQLSIVYQTNTKYSLPFSLPPPPLRLLISLADQNKGRQRRGYR